MPIIDASTSRSISSLLRAQQTGFRDAVNEQGQLVRNRELTGLKARLVSLVGQGSVRPGSFAGRVIKLVVGRQNFEHISRQLRGNADRSAKNVLAAFTKAETEGLDTSLKTSVAARIHRRLGTKRSGFSAREFASLHNAINKKLIPERLAARQSLISSIEEGRPTPKMQALSQSELRIAGEALSTGRTPGQVKKSTRTPFRDGVNLDKVNAATQEFALLDKTIRNSGEISKLQAQVSRLEGDGATAPGAQERLGELQTELAQLREQADTRADNLRGSYMDTLAGLYEDVSTGKDSLTLPASQYREDRAQGPGPLSPGEIPDPHNPPEGLDRAQTREHGAGKSVSFDTAYTREDPAADGPDRTQLWEFAESKEPLTMEQVETALAQADMDSLQDPLLSRLDKKMSKSLNEIVKRQGMDPDISARVRTAREHPLLNPEARFTGSRYHDLDDIRDLLSIMDVNEPLVSDKKLALEMYESMLRTEQSRLTSPDEMTTIAELKQHPVFEKHVLDHIEERISETTLRGRGKERATYVLRTVTNDASISTENRTRAAALLERLQTTRPQ